jgi:excisionase family DNA binding protein
MNVKELFITATLAPEERQLLVQEVVLALMPLIIGKNPSVELATDVEQPVSKKDVCRLLRCSEPTMTKWMTAGKIPFYRKGRRVYFFRSEVLKSLEQPLKRRA